MSAASLFPLYTLESTQSMSNCHVFESLALQWLCFCKVHILKNIALLMFFNITLEL